MVSHFFRLKKSAIKKAKKLRALGLRTQTFKGNYGRGQSYVVHSTRR